MCKVILQRSLILVDDEPKLHLRNPSSVTRLRGSMSAIVDAKLREKRVTRREVSHDNVR